MELDNELIPLLRELQRRKFFGTLEIRYLEGNINTVYKTESLKGSPVSTKRGNQDEQTISG